VFQRALEDIEKARDEGLKITFDIYPYAITSTVLYLVLPEWVAAGGKRETLRYLRDKPTREKIKAELLEKAGDFADITIARGDIDSLFVGKTLCEIAQNQETSILDALFNIIIASEDQVVAFMPFINDKNAEMAILNKASIIASDGAGYKISSAKEAAMLIHPRNFGTFPKFFKEYAVDKKSLSWEEAVYKITLMPAEKIGLEKRGKIAKNYFADIVIFDPQKIKDTATFKDPFQYAEGVEYVLINGRFALKRGKFQKGRWGRVLRK